jgi:hypothetical protein
VTPQGEAGDRRPDFHKLRGTLSCFRRLRGLALHQAPLIFRTPVGFVFRWKTDEIIALRPRRLRWSRRASAFAGDGEQ